MATKRAGETVLERYGSSAGDSEPRPPPGTQKTNAANGKGLTPSPERARAAEAQLEADRLARERISHAARERFQAEIDEAGRADERARDRLIEQAREELAALERERVEA